jgi:molybdopterin molybdotransferase
LTDLPWPQAWRIAYATADPLPPRRLPLAAAIGAVLAEPLVARSALPPFDTAAMDGYAVAGPGPWRVVGRQLAGAEPPAAPAPGEAVEIATGALAPPWVDAVLPYEDAAVSDGRLVGDVAPGRHIRRAGEECGAGEELVGAGAPVTAATAGLAAAVGHDDLLAHPAPVVAPLVSGDELLAAGLPRDGRVRDALGPVLPALVAGCGGRPEPVRRLPDRADALADAIAAAAGDVVVTTGGSSVGPADHLPRVLAELGAKALVRGVACRPGHPQLLARLPDGRWLVGLPGNPLAALVGVVTLLAPLLARLAGRPMPRTTSATLAGALNPSPTLTRLVPVAFDLTGLALPLAHGGSAMLRGAARADALAVLPPGAGPIEVVEIVRLPA